MDSLTKFKFVWLKLCGCSHSFEIPGFVTAATLLATNTHSPANTQSLFVLTDPKRAHTVLTHTHGHIHTKADNEHVASLNPRTAPETTMERRSLSLDELCLSRQLFLVYCFLKTIHRHKCPTVFLDRAGKLRQ